AVCSPRRRSVFCSCRCSSCLSRVGGEHRRHRRHRLHREPMRELMLATALVGCTLAPRYERPPLPVPDRFPGGGGSLAAADQGWRTMFGDPRLQALIALALANNRDLRVAALNVEVAGAQYRTQRAGLTPSVEALGVGSHFQGSGISSARTSG